MVSCPNRVIIIGGSLSALIHGIMLSRRGSHVTILERSDGPYLQSHMAGVCLGPDMQWFLNKYDDYSHIPLGIDATALQSLDENGQAKVFLRGSRIMTSWESLYFRLRANFDGWAGDFVPKDHTQSSRTSPLGAAKYEMGKRVSSVQVDGDRIKVGVASEAGPETILTADLVLGADGPNSVVRRLFCGNSVTRKYSGYLAWRGIVPESEVTPETRAMFKGNITYNMLGEHGHIIVYNIPGEAGSITDGQRCLNLCWYQNVDHGKQLSTVMTDLHGVKHQTTVSEIEPYIWRQQIALARSIPTLQGRYLEILDKIRSPFVHQVCDYHCPEVSFMNGKVLLVGDASTLLRPHIGFSTSQAAYQCRLLDEYVFNHRMSMEDWDWQITRFTWTHWLRSIWFGEFFQRPWTCLMSAIFYWNAAAVNRIRYTLGIVPIWSY